FAAERCAASAPRPVGLAMYRTVIDPATQQMCVSGDSADRGPRAEALFAPVVLLEAYPHFLVKPDRDFHSITSAAARAPGEPSGRPHWSCARRRFPAWRSGR